MALFNLPRSTKESDSKISQKVKNGKGSSVGLSVRGGSNDLLTKITTAMALVEKALGKYRERYEWVTDEKRLEEYIDCCIDKGLCGIDTETSGLDPILDEIIGVGLYAEGEKAIYIPLNHVSYITGQRVPNLLSKEFVSMQLQRLADNNVQMIYHNAKFDYRFILNYFGVDLPIYWDTQIAARILNENEPSNRLKDLYVKYCLNGDEDAWKYDDLFKGVPFNYIPIKTAYLYAARDPEITVLLMRFQQRFLGESYEDASDDYKGIANIFHNIEMPLIPIIAEMENTGMGFDLEFADELSLKYNDLLEKAKNEFYSTCDNFGERLDNYRARMGAANKLEYPINISSPTQIAIMLYDVLGIESPNSEKPRATGVDELKAIDHPIAQAILKVREIEKILSTYVEKLPKIVNPKTGRIHASFNQIGADTGRFSSSDPNLQNIPSGNKEIRKMFVATPGYYLVGSDYSAQEPRLTAHMSRDEKMIQAYRDGKDVYAEIAAVIYDVKYEDCLEEFPDGTKNPEGKKRRGTAKKIVLAINYGMSKSSLAGELNVSLKEANNIYEKVSAKFPGLIQFKSDSEEMARTVGYVTTFWGRKRRLPDMQLPKYEFSYVSGVSKDFDPLDDEDNLEVEVDPKIVAKYTKLLDNAKKFMKKSIINRARVEEGVLIVDNTGRIASASRQTVNARIQGSAADQTKKAMILIGQDPQLREWGFRLLIPVHDELIGECPKENIKKVAERFNFLMVDAAKELLVPSKCDVEITERWFGDPIELEEE